MTQEVSKINAALPAHLQGKVKTEKIGNIDQSDMIIPRIKLLQATSPEVTEIEGAKAGEFWHSILQQGLGKVLTGIPIILRKTHVLWAPRGDERGILARSRDGIRWDPPQGSFDVKFKGNPRTYTWVLKPTVAESRLDQFGTQRDDDPGSPPAASLTYETLWWFPQESFGPVIVLNSRGSIKACQNFINIVEAKPAEHFYQLYAIHSVVDKGPTNEPFFNYKYQSLGYADAEECTKAEGFYRHFKDMKFRPSDENEESAPPNGSRAPAGATERTADSKF